jgi:DNA-binding NarL/FixJ family response regulator
VGAEPWAARAASELRAAGETLQRRPVDGLATLTPQELQIARYIAEGRSNRDVATLLFVSPRTVAYHLEKIFRKLGVASRADIARVAFEEG